MIRYLLIIVTIIGGQQTFAQALNLKGKRYITASYTVINSGQGGEFGYGYFIKNKTPLSLNIGYQEGGVKYTSFQTYYSDLVIGYNIFSHSNHFLTFAGIGTRIGYEKLNAVIEDSNLDYFNYGILIRGKQEIYLLKGISLIGCFQYNKMLLTKLKKDNYKVSIGIKYNLNY